MALNTKPEVKYPITPPSQQPLPRVVLDWRAYFYKFVEAHGEPIVDGNVLLFQDGWRYSADDYAGPEYPPPKELQALLELQIRYWKRRRIIVRAERDRLDSTIQGLDELRKSRPVPLQRAVIAWDDVSGKLSRQNTDIDWFALKERLKWLIEDVRRCDDALHQLGEL